CMDLIKDGSLSPSFPIESAFPLLPPSFALAKAFRRIPHLPKSSLLPQFLEMIFYPSAHQLISAKKIYMIALELKSPHFPLMPRPYLHHKSKELFLSPNL